MCLSYVDKREKEKLPRGEYHTGWKVVKIYQDKKHFESMFNIKGKLNTWIRCTNTYNLAVNQDYLIPTYPTGFHIFKTRAAARKYRMAGFNRTVVKVKYRKVVARGRQNHYNLQNNGSGKDLQCVIAKEMYVEYIPRSKRNQV